jgi:hypothetical protein
LLLFKAPFTLSCMRTDSFLQAKLKEFLDTSFSDMEVVNTLTIGFGRRARRRFGSITMTRDKKRSHITINGLFRDPAIPEQIISATLAHELCHYAHGFSSPLPRKYSSPHAGGVILREMKKRGLEALYHFERQWTKAHWGSVLQREFLPVRPRRPLKTWSFFNLRRLSGIM